MVVIETMVVLELWQLWGQYGGLRNRDSLGNCGGLGNPGGRRTFAALGTI